MLELLITKELLSDLKRYEDAIQAYDETLEINPQYADAWYNKGNAFKNIGRNDEANKSFEEASRLQEAPGFEIIFSIAGLIMITHLFKRKNF
ncbi:MAG: tetratricopeptide repeat protein [Candidatus Methanoperedens sp.]